MPGVELFGWNGAPLELEKTLRREGFFRVAGVDEAGRGAMAGPVVAAAVIFPENVGELVNRVRDSKRLSPRAREELLPLIEASALSIGVGVVGRDEIDRVNILNAALEAMRIAVSRLSPPPDLCLVDGNTKAPLECPQRTIVKGDDRVFSIGAASVVAKVTRDRLMDELDGKYPRYGFRRHKGYGTSDHRRALAVHGPCPEHRLSFSFKAEVL